MNRVLIASLLILFPTFSRGDNFSTGFKGTFKSSTVVVISLYECREYIQHLKAGDESYGGNLAYYNLLDVFDPGDTFTVIRVSGEYSEIVAIHQGEDRKGNSFDGWVANEWIRKNNSLPNKTPRNINSEKSI